MKNRKILKKILIIFLILIAIGLLVCIAPFLYFVVVVLWNMFIVVPKEPEITHGEFPYELTYEYKNNIVTIKDTIICDYKGHSFALDSGNTRNWDYYIKNNENYGYYYLDRENEPDLYIEVPLDCEYYMSAPNSNIENSKPYIHYIDEETGSNYYEEDLSSIISAKIIEWNPSKPLKNNYK